MTEQTQAPESPAAAPETQTPAPETRTSEPAPPPAPAPERAPEPAAATRDPIARIEALLDSNARLSAKSRDLEAAVGAAEARAKLADARYQLALHGVTDAELAEDFALILTSKYEPGDYGKQAKKLAGKFGALAPNRPTKKTPPPVDDAEQTPPSDPRARFRERWRNEHG